MAKISGVWSINKTIGTSSKQIEQIVNFNLVHISTYNPLNKIIIFTGNSLSYSYNNEKGAGSISVCTYGNWQSGDYRIIDFGTTEQTVTDEFYTWLTANATQIIQTTTIIYNGTELASLEEGQTANFPQGVKAKTDVSIAFGSKGSITYKGVTTEIEKGKTATLLCGGKKFATDVVVAVEKAEATASTLTLNNIGNWGLYYAVDSDDNTSWPNAYLSAGESVVLTGIKSFVYCVASIMFLTDESTFTNCEAVWDGTSYCKLYPKGENATANLYAYD